MVLMTPPTGLCDFPEGSKVPPAGLSAPLWDLGLKKVRRRGFSGSADIRPARSRTSCLVFFTTSQKKDEAQTEGGGRCKSTISPAERLSIVIVHA